MSDRRSSVALAVALAGFLCAAPLHAQGVRGVVVDEATAAPLTGVLVAILNEQNERVAAVLTDADGAFTAPVPGPGVFHARAERIGLQSADSAPFEIVGTSFGTLRIQMADRAVELEGLVVDARVQSCRVDAVQAPRIQRWWQSVRTALDVSALVQSERMARFRVQQFERRWSADLRSVLSEDTRLRVGFASRPFVSADAERLLEGGFVQGEEGSREYFAPDADVLLSDGFLQSHCFSVVSDDDNERLVGLHFEPTRDNRSADILGTLWVDTVSSMLDRLQYRYANLNWLPANEAGGEVAFRYLPSGAWIVSDWFIRMPQVGVRREARGSSSADAMVVAGYVDVGGRVRQLSTTAGTRDGVSGTGIVRGEIQDSLRGGPLVGARVVVLGTRFTARTDGQGRFQLTGVPVGEHSISFFHEDLTTWGIPSPFVDVVVEAGGFTSTASAVPSFRSAAANACGGGSPRAEAILTGRVLDAGAPVEGAEVYAYWESPAVSGPVATGEATVVTGSNGRYTLCGAPAEVRLDVTVSVDGRPAASAVVTLPVRAFTARDFLLGGS